MTTLCRTIWCGPCAMRLGLKMKSEITDVRSVRWGLVELPFLTCDCCRYRIYRDEIAVGVTAYLELENYVSWEWEFLYDMDVGLAEADEAACVASSSQEELSGGGDVTPAKRREASLINHAVATIVGMILGVGLVNQEFMIPALLALLACTAGVGLI